MKKKQHEREYIRFKEFEILLIYLFPFKIFRISLLQNLLRLDRMEIDI
jgi:hypothetical protein